VLIDNDVNDVVLSSPAELGTVSGNQFICTGTEPGILTATFGGSVTTTIFVTPIATSGVQLKLESVLIDNRNDYAIEASAITAGGLQPIAAQVLMWTVDDPAICAVENGVLHALSNGTTFVTGALGELTDRLDVTVENSAVNRLVSDVFVPSEWAATTISSWSSSVSFNTDNLPSSWTHGAAFNLTYQTGRGPYLRLTKDFVLYGCPDTVKIVVNMGSLQLKDATIYLQANNSTKTAAYKFNPPFAANQDFELSVPIDELFVDEGVEIFPLRFNNVNFNVESSNTVGGAYTLAVKEIALVYNGVDDTGIVVPQTARFAVYPNPVKENELYIRIESGQRPALAVAVYTLAGQKVLSQTVSVDSNGVGKLANINLPAGTYLLTAFLDGGAESVKLIIQ
jgi:hypothetical protein